MRMPGRVYLVGAGPGDPELLTVKAMRLLQAAEVVVFDRLVSDAVLALANPDAEMVAVGKRPKRHPVPQEEINAILIEQAREGRMTVRLKGGDPFIFGRGSEEAMAVRSAGIPCEVVPGITAAQGCAATIGIPLTHRGLATGVRLVTGHCRQDQPLDFDWEGMADPETTLVVYMGAANIAEISDSLVRAGLSSSTPVLAVNNGTTPRERRIVCDLGTVPSETASAHFQGPVLFVIGAVVSLYANRDICPIVHQALALASARHEAACHA